MVAVRVCSEIKSGSFGKLARETRPERKRIRPSSDPCDRNAKCVDAYLLPMNRSRISQRDPHVLTCTISVDLNEFCHIPAVIAFTSNARGKEFLEPIQPSIPRGGETEKAPAEGRLAAPRLPRSLQWKLLQVPGPAAFRQGRQATNQERDLPCLTTATTWASVAAGALSAP